MIRLSKTNLAFPKKLSLAFTNTGERPIIETHFGEIHPVFRFSYEYVRKYSKNISILDYGCGGRYGAEYLVRFTKKDVTGFDIDVPTIAAVKRFYKSRANLKFTSDRDRLESYDVVVSFQVIEHLTSKAINNYLLDIKKSLLKLGGYFLLATVNKNITSHNLKKLTFPFQEYEFTPQELKKRLSKYFKRVKVYDQIDFPLIPLVKQDKYYYKNRPKNIAYQIIDIISQFNFVRITARYITLFISLQS